MTNKNSNSNSNNYHNRCFGFAAVITSFLCFLLPANSASAVRIAASSSTNSATTKNPNNANLTPHPDAVWLAGNHNNGNNGDDISSSANIEVIETDRSRRHLLPRDQPKTCLLWLRKTMFEDHHSDSAWMCELYSSELSSASSSSLSRVVGGGAGGGGGRGDGMIRLKIDRMDDDEFEDMMGAESGKSILHYTNAYVEDFFDSSDETLLVIEDYEQNRNRNLLRVEDLDENDERHADNRRLRRRGLNGKDKKTGRRLAPAEGTLSVLVARVTDGDGKEISSNANQLESDIFLDDWCLQTQFARCSHNQMILEKAEAPGVVNGIVEITTEAAVDDSDYNMYGYGLKALGALQAEVSSWYSIDFLMFCRPDPGSWVAYAYINSYHSHYRQEWCNRMSSQIHEIGHNIGLAHSGILGGSEYADQAGMMGYSYSSDDWPKQCYVGPKNYQLGWFAEQVESIDPREEVGTYQLIGQTDFDFGQSNNDRLVVLRLENEANSANPDYYISFNRAKDYNVDTLSGKNAVVIHWKKAGPSAYALSWRLDELYSGDSYSISDYGDSGETVTIKVVSIVGDVATVTIENSDIAPDPAPSSLPTPKPVSPTPKPVLPTRSPTKRPTRLPTKGPSKPPTKMPVTPPPTRNPTKGPTNPPSRPPTKRPTRLPTKRPTKPPTKMPVTPPPTRNPTQSPTKMPVADPTSPPTRNPTRSPTKSPTKGPTEPPTLPPTKGPTESPTRNPTRTPTKSPTRPPTRSPTKSPTKGPTELPTKSPTKGPTESPTRNPTRAPTKSPTRPPTRFPTKSPTSSPSSSPSFVPTPAPTNPSVSIGVGMSGVPADTPNEQIAADVVATIENVASDTRRIRARMLAPTEDSGFDISATAKDATCSDSRRRRTKCVAVVVTFTALDGSNENTLDQIETMAEEAEESVDDGTFLEQLQETSNDYDNVEAEVLPEIEAPSQAPTKPKCVDVKDRFKITNKRGTKEKKVRCKKVSLRRCKWRDDDGKKMYQYKCPVRCRSRIPGKKLKKFWCDFE